LCDRGKEGGRPLLRITGFGRMQGTVRSMADPRVKLVGEQSGRHITWSMQRFQALLLPDDEDFGTIEVEARVTRRPSMPPTVVTR
jgi:hypothetical protein